MTSSTTAHSTPAEQRASLRAEFARVLRRALDRHDITQAQLADAVGIAPSKVGRWTDHRAPEVPCAASIALMPRPVAVDVLTWMSAFAHLTVADDLNFDDVRDHLEHLHTVIREGSEVFASYSKVATAGHTPTPAVRRDLMRDLRESISAQTSLLRDLEAQEAADSHGVARRPSEPRMQAVRP
jgi:transcriptional regulator with XRE-family HTH domain